ncbi:hypothetical protein [Amycolatopsis palatopharyngis]|uniref:hypothetical protein n=1 Tax=Amycolatopsis palatopharyngis TaxID=187982 RepID=UPI000E230F7E
MPSAPSPAPTTTFLPLTTEAALRLSRTGPEHNRALVLRHRVAEADAAASRCWTALLAGCDSTARRSLGPRLRQLSEATSLYVGTRWWFNDGSAHRRRVAQSQVHIEDAIADGDGQEFAMAFIGYDHAMASAVVCGVRPLDEIHPPQHTRSPTQ